MAPNGFNLLSVRFSERYDTPYQIFFKQHKIREESDDRPSDLTLLVCNIPPYYNQDAMKALFGKFGAVKHVYFSSTKSITNIVDTELSNPETNFNQITGYKIAYVVFQSTKSIQAALKWKNTTPLVLCNDNFSLVTGVQKWCLDYNASIKDPQQLQNEVDKFMKTFDENQSIKEKLLLEAAEEDIEGWTTITKRGKNPGVARKKSVKESIMKKMRKKRRRKELLNFYTFQIKESKLNHLCKLREKFEEDKKKVDKLKNSRKFRPFS